MDLRELGAYLTEGLADLLRIEALDYYDSAADDPHFAAWLETGHVEPDEGWQGWLDQIRDYTDRGITWRRVHVIAEGKPLTDYLRFEIEAQYPISARHGEEIRILTVPEKQAAIIPDFYVANGERVAMSHYNKAGKFITAEDAGRSTSYWINVAADLWETATPLDEWTQRRRAA